MLLGGAALTRTYVERDLREVYKGRLFYGKDAFEGLRVMDRLGEIKARSRCRRRGLGPGPDGLDGRAAGRFAPMVTVPKRAEALPDRSPEVEDDNEIFVPPFTGSQVVKGIPLDDIAAYLNETALFRNQWQFRPESRGGRRRRSRNGSGRCCASSWPLPGRRTCCARPSSTATGRPTATARIS